MTAITKAALPVTVRFISAEGSSVKVDKTIERGQALQAKLDIDGVAVPIWFGLSHAGEIWVMLAGNQPDGTRLCVPGPFNGNAFPHVVLEAGQQVIVPAEAPALLAAIPGPWPCVLLRDSGGGKYIAQCNFSMITFPKPATTPADNDELAQLFADDQADRQFLEGPTALPDDQVEEGLKHMRANDRVRRERVETLLAEGKVRTANDFYFAGHIFHHGGRLSVEDWIMGHQLFMAAAILGHKEARWLCASSFDRVLQALGHVQCFGTNFDSNAEGRYEMAACANMVPDYVRAIFGLRPVAQARDTSNGINQRLED